MTAGRAVQTAIVAIGGNALAPPGERSTIYDQFRHTRESLAPIVDLALAGWNVCIVHGNGPQVGDELVRNELARARGQPAAARRARGRNRRLDRLHDPAVARERAAPRRAARGTWSR